MNSHVLQIVWPIDDEGFTRSELEDEAKEQLERFADEADAIIIGPPYFLITDAEDTPGWHAYLGGSLLVALVPVEVQAEEPAPDLGSVDPACPAAKHGNTISPTWAVWKHGCQCPATVAAAKATKRAYAFGKSGRRAAEEVDEGRVQKAIAGSLPVKELTRAERVAAVTHLVQVEGLTDTAIAGRLRWGALNGREMVCRFRRAHGIASAHQQHSPLTRKAAA